MKAADLLNPNHPLHKALVSFSNGKPTKRQARKFLQKHDQYRRA